MVLKSRERQYKPDLTVKEALLHVPNKPDPKQRKIRDQGRWTRKGLCHFFFDLFETNEQLPPGQRRTNAALIEVVIREFPKNYSLHVRLRKGEKTSINEYRRRYNTGRLVPGRPVVWVSFRYNDVGERVDYFTGKKRLTAIQQKEIQAKYQNKILENYKKYYKRYAIDPLGESANAKETK